MDAPIPFPARKRRTYVVHLIESYKIEATTEENAIAQAECGLFDPDTIDVQVEELED